METNSLEKFLLLNGDLITIELGFRMLLHDLDHIFFVESGDLDLFILKPIGTFADAKDEFFITLSKDNSLFLGELIGGPLFFMCNLTQSSLIFPFILAPNFSPYKVILKANSKSQLRKISIQALENYLSEHPEIYPLFRERSEEWISLFMQIFNKTPAESRVSYLEDGINSILEKNTNLVIPRHRKASAHLLINWSKILQGSVYIVGIKSNLADAESPLIPLHPNLWLKNSEPVEIELFSSLLQIPFLEMIKAINAFHIYVLNAAKAYLEYHDEIDLYSINLKKTSDELKLKGVFDYLGNLMSPEKRYHVSFYGSKTFETCTLIGHYINHHFVAPHHTRGNDVFSQVYEICVSSKAQSRQVFLKGHWWREGSNPLLVVILGEKPDQNAAIPGPNGDYSLFTSEKITEKTTITKKIAKTISSKAVLFYRSFSRLKSYDAMSILSFGLKGRSKDIMWVLLSSFLANLVFLFIPFFNQVLFDSVIPSSDDHLLFQLIGGLIIVAITGGLFTQTREYAILRIENLITHDLEVAYWTKLLSLPLHFFRKYSVGNLFVRLSSVEYIREAIAGNFSRMLINSIFCIFYLIPMLYFSVSLTLFAVVSLIIISVLMSTAVYYGIIIQRHITEVRGILTGKLLQIISGISKIRIYGVEGRIFSYWGVTLARMKKLEMKMGFITNLSSTLNRTAPTAISLVITTAIVYFYHPKQQILQLRLSFH